MLTPASSVMFGCNSYINTPAIVLVEGVVKHNLNLLPVVGAVISCIVSSYRGTYMVSLDVDLH